MKLHSCTFCSLIITGYCVLKTFNDLLMWQCLIWGPVLASIFYLRSCTCVNVLLEVLYFSQCLTWGPVLSWWVLTWSWIRPPQRMYWSLWCHIPVIEWSQNGTICNKPIDMFHVLGQVGCWWLSEWMYKFNIQDHHYWI